MLQIKWWPKFLYRRFEVANLTIILRNRADLSPDTLLTRPLAELAKIRRYSTRLSRIIVLLFNTLMTKQNFSTFIRKEAGKTTIFLRDTQNYVYRRIYPLSMHDKY